MTARTFLIRNTLEKAILVGAIGRQVADYESIPEHVARQTHVVAKERAACSYTLDQAKALKTPGPLVLPVLNCFQTVLALEAYARSAPEKEAAVALLLVRRIERESKTVPSTLHPIVAPDIARMLLVGATP